MAAGLQVKAALAAARAAGVERLDAQLLLAHHLGVGRSWLLAHDDETLAPALQQAFEHDLQRRAAGVPLAYLVGEREFRGLAFAVSPAVLVPRPETELLVEWALELLPPERAAEVADLGTGSGAIAVSVALARPQARVTATDIDAAALAMARANAARHGAVLQLLQGSWCEPLGAQRFDLLLSNPPYIAGADPHLAALVHEPRHALTPEGDGLDALRTICAAAPARLQPGGWLLLEHGYDQGEATRALLQQAGLEAAQTRHDLAGLPRCSGARRPGG